jgi:hypothetical protein
MRTLIAVIIGVALTGLLLFIGDASFARVTDTTIVSGYAGSSHVAEFVALAWTLVCISLGAIVTMRIRNTKEALSGFIIGELFFGVGLLHQFWHAPTWYGAIAMLLVIPGALLGAWIGSQLQPRATASV